MSENKAKAWVRFNPLTQTYDTPDGTNVAAEVAENVHCLADAVLIAAIRGEQRTTVTKEKGGAA